MSRDNTRFNGKPWACSHTLPRCASRSKAVRRSTRWLADLFAAAFELFVVGDCVLPLLLAFLGLLLGRLGVLLGGLPVVVLVLPLALEVARVEVVAGLDAFRLRDLCLFELDFGLRRLLVRLRRDAGLFEPILLLIEPGQFGLGHLHAVTSDLLVVLRRVVPVLIVRRNRRLLLGARLLDLELGLLFLGLGHVDVTLEPVELALRGADLAARHLELALRLKHRLPLAAWYVVERRVVQLVFEAAATAHGADRGRRPGQEL